MAVYANSCRRCNCFATPDSAIELVVINNTSKITEVTEDQSELFRIGVFCNEDIPRFDIYGEV